MAPEGTARISSGFRCFSAVNDALGGVALWEEMYDGRREQAKNMADKATVAFLERNRSGPDDP